MTAYIFTISIRHLTKDGRLHIPIAQSLVTIPTALKMDEVTLS